MRPDNVVDSGFVSRVPTPRVALVSGGLEAYWPQFAGLFESLCARHSEVSENLAALDLEVLDLGFISNEAESRHVGDALCMAQVDAVIVFVATYLTSSMIVPIMTSSSTPILFLQLQPSARMDHAHVNTRDWLEYCGGCALPEIGNVCGRLRRRFHCIASHMDDPEIWPRVRTWATGAGAVAALRRARIGVMGHLYPGMLDVGTDLALLCRDFGCQFDILEFDDLKHQLDHIPRDSMEQRLHDCRQIFSIHESVDISDLEWAVCISVALDRVARERGLSGLAYYHRGLDGEIFERIGAGMILGATLLTSSGMPCVGEFDIRTALAMLIGQVLGHPGSFSEVQACDFKSGVVEMGHDGPANLAVSAGSPLLRGLGVFHGKRGWGVSTEMSVLTGPATVLGVGQLADGKSVIVSSRGDVVDGPRMSIGNTSSRVRFGLDAGAWLERWSGSGVGHHWALCRGHFEEAIDVFCAETGLTHVSI